MTDNESQWVQHPWLGGEQWITSHLPGRTNSAALCVTQQREFPLNSLRLFDRSLALGGPVVAGSSANRHASGPQTSEVVIMRNVLARHELSTGACSSTTICGQRETGREEQQHTYTYIELGCKCCQAIIPFKKLKELNVYFDQ